MNNETLPGWICSDTHLQYLETFSFTPAEETVWCAGCREDLLILQAVPFFFWIVMIKLSGRMPTSFCFWTWSSSRLLLNTVSQVSWASKQLLSQDPRRIQTLQLAWASVKQTWPLWPLSKNYSLPGLSEAWLWLKTAYRYYNTLTTVKVTVVRVEKEWMTTTSQRAEDLNRL